ncbi:hypothetical protein [Desulfofustis limnaeus]|jgi:nickel transport protein|uniref:Carboxypeptidase regulatory-like domain-containing protein n=1 Tax=Desulfofustis limnaeus TaxID=2740163 RepID=A0ABM7W6A4_9BACT|nr:hypothetical protein [Desulfofustis limnaeus]MDX9895735.1 hypothetical protein [Desulfofustis sp.]BDD86471.1 hypothetical protein DPPLL_08360 [Desulfofustis limnaeus]
MTTGSSRLSLLLLFCFLAAAQPATAHKVNLFALVENGTINGTATFSGGRPAKQAQITVIDSNSGAVVREGRTDEHGAFSLPLPQQAAELQGDLVIVVSAGDGHRNEWTITVDEYLARTDRLDASALPPEQPPLAEQTASRSMTTVTDERLQHVVETAVERQIAPLRRTLLETRDQRPLWRDVVAGIGYIIGIFGIIAWIKHRKGGIS